MSHISTLRRPGKPPVRIERRRASWNAMSLDVPRRLAQAVTLDLPMPPSKNELHQRTARGQCRSVRYVAWRTEAAQEAIIVQRAPSVLGPYALHILVCEADTGCDLGNIETATSDLLQHCRIIENDNLARRILSEWAPPGMLRSGIRVVVVSTSVPSAPALSDEAVA